MTIDCCVLLETYNERVQLNEEKQGNNDTNSLRGIVCVEVDVDR